MLVEQKVFLKDYMKVEPMVVLTVDMMVVEKAVM